MTPRDSFRSSHVESRRTRPAKPPNALDSHSTAPDGPIAQAINRASAEEYPRVHVARDDIMSGTGDERFAWSVNVLVRGILSRSQTHHSELE
jgi:hypothetical protein